MDAIDQQVSSMRIEAPWVTMTRSDAVRWLLGIALEHERGRLFAPKARVPEAPETQTG